MRDVDDMIDEVLDREQRELLGRIGDEPGFFGMALGMFGGRLGWVNIVLMIVQGVGFVAALYAGWRFYEATDTVTQLRWGLPSAVLLILSAMIKLTMWPGLHADRVIRELKRFELAMLRARAGGAN